MQSPFYKQNKIVKVDISLKQLIDVDTTNELYYRRTDNIFPNQVLTSYTNVSRRDAFRFKYLTDLIVAGSGVTITNLDGILTISSTGGGTYTVDNGLTESPAGNFQLGGLLTQSSIIDGDGFLYGLDLVDMYAVGIQAEQKVLLEANDGVQSQKLYIYPQNNQLLIGYDTGTSNQELEIAGDKFYMRVENWATASIGDVLTLISNTTGRVEFQTPSGGGGGLLYGLATQSPAGVYTTTITGATTPLTAGDVFVIKFDTVNDGASTLNINGSGAVNIYKNTNVPIASGDIKANQTVEVVYDGTNFQAIGLVSDQLLAYVHNAEGAVISKGQAVYAYQATGNKMSVKLARADQDATSAKTIGLVYDSSIGIGADGYIIIQGVIEGVNTAAFSAGDTLYLSGSTFGGVTATKPYAPIHLVYVGIVERANAGNGQIYVRCQNGYELDEIHDVDLITTPPVNNDVLVFDTSTTPDLWVNKSIPTILGYTPVPDTRTLTINGTAQDLSADRSWTVTAGSADLPEISVSTANIREDDYAPAGWPTPSNVVKVIKINSTNTNYMMCLGGLSNPTAGRIVTIYNASTGNNLIIIENLSTSSTAANRFRMTNNIAYFLLPNRSVTFLYDGTYWTQFSASGTGGFDYFDDFTSVAQTLGAANLTTLMSTYSSGTGAGNQSNSIGAVDGWGAVNMSTGSTATGFTYLSINTRRAGANAAFGATLATSSMPYVTVSKVKLDTLGTALQDYQAFAGISGTSSLGTLGMGYYWHYGGSATTFWTTRAQNTAGALVTNTSSLAASTSDVWLGVYKVGGANTRDAVFFFSTNGVVYTFAYKFVGTASTYGGFPIIGVGSSVGTTPKGFIADWMGAAFNLPR